MELTVKQFQNFNLHLRRKEKELSAILRSREQKAIAPQSTAEMDPVAPIMIQVQDAIRRIQFHAYGACIACGRPIELHLLDKTPWTPYCAEDQRKYQPAGFIRWKTAAACKLF